MEGIKKALFISVLGLGAPGEATSQNVFEQDLGPDTANEESENFLSLHQKILLSMGSETKIETPLGQYGKSFSLRGREYSLFLDKDVEGMPNLLGYKRTVVINDGDDQRSEYFMIDEKTVYQQETLSEINPLDLSQITELSGKIEGDFERWKAEIPNQASVSV